MIVVWRASAVADLFGIVEHISEENPTAARRVARDLVLAADSLEVFPNRGRTGSAPGTRELTAVRSYVIVYKVLEDRVRISRIWHSAQDRS